MLAVPLLLPILLSAAPVNLLLNPEFRFHSFGNSRTADRDEWKSGSIPGWDSAAYGDATVVRTPRMAGWTPAVMVEAAAAIHPGKQLSQIVLLAETSLRHGDPVSLVARGWLPEGGQLTADLRLLKLDSAAGTWSPGDFGSSDKRTFPRFGRGELIPFGGRTATIEAAGHGRLTIDNLVVEGAFTESSTQSTDQPNTVGIEVIFRNPGTADAWVYAPTLSAGPTAVEDLPERELPTAYRSLPRTMQKLWRGEPLHIIAMGSSIDRGSANPKMMPYDEDPASATFKQPLTVDTAFDGALVGHPEWNDYCGWWQHWLMYTNRFRRWLMQQFDYPVDKLLLNVMACDGSSISEAHSGFADYAELRLPPDPNLNAHGAGKSWQELYPAVFARPEGPRPDLIIFGSGANEKVAGADEVALFEGAIRWFQRHYPGVEFVFCMWQNRQSYTPNVGHLQELALRYQIPYLDLGSVMNRTTAYGNSNALVPPDGHPQAAAHLIWAMMLERGFMAADPTESGVAQLRLPERAHPDTIGWEGDIRTYAAPDPRIRQGTGFILDDTMVNLWATTKDELVTIKVDGAADNGSRRKPQGSRDVRNSTFATGRLSFGDRHLVEVAGTESKLVAADSKPHPSRRWFGIDHAAWTVPGERQPFASSWGAPYGAVQTVLRAGQSASIAVVGTDLSVAYVDQDGGGRLVASVDGQPRLEVATNRPFAAASGEALFMENRRGILGLPYGWHILTVTAADGPVSLLGVFTYDTRPNRHAERVERGPARPGETVTFTTPFKARPVILCSGGVKTTVDQVSATQVTFAGDAPGFFEAVGE